MILGALLAGGASSRFGRDKAIEPLAGRALGDHVLDALRPFVDAIVVCGRDWPGEASVADRPRAGLGPLGGIAAALAHARVIGCDHVITAPCDTPRLEPAMLAALAAASHATVLRGCPVIGIWPATLSPMLDTYLAAHDDRSMRGWARHVAASWLDMPAPMNVNRPADLAALG